MKPVRLMSGFLTVGVWTLLSRVLGFARDIIIAARLGDGPVAEAFLVAFSLPNMFRRFFAEGAFNMAFVPLFARKLEAGKDALGFARDAATGLASLLIVFTLIAQVAMPGLVLAMASGFAEDERFPMAVLFGRICFPYILLISLAALLSGVLNASGRFVAAAAAPVMLNVVLVTAVLAAGWAGWPYGLALSVAVPVAGVAQLAILWIAAAKAGFRVIPRRPQLTPELKRLARIAGPAMLAGGVMQVNLLVGRQVASYYDGAIQYLNLADRLYQLPLGVIAIAIGVVLLPDLSRRIAAEDTVGGKAAMNRAAEFALLLTVPAALALVAIPGPIVSVLYERGAFDTSAAARTAIVTAIYGAGLPAFVLQKVWQPLYFARSDTKTPFHYALVAMVVNAGVALGLAPWLGFYAAALGTTLAGWIMLALLVRGARNMGEATRVDDRLRRRIPRIVLSALLMAALLVGLAWLLREPLAQGGWRYLALFGLVASGILSYFAFAQWLGATRLSEITGAMKRRR
ncbi:murein biosynthesis integral membrane protein MurJ [Tropicimonas sp. IMCC34011]|uniref:murein biosynthesis integral membrane protein MurJ n=1 Tax=Tropicimonas sp. IMCC34011 TaxID=2248759 RepID=UPI000E22B137|nr:murein biosynthesis integral membrane protein MurJ [Tropicimonas sp. IMCC34011]